MRELIIADQQDITCLGLKFLADTLSSEISKVQVAENKILLIEYLIAEPSALVVIDYSLFDFADVNDLLIIRNRFFKSDWIIFSEDLSDGFIRQLVFSEYPFSIVLKSSSSEEILSALSLTFQKQRFICNQITSHLLNPNKVIDKSESKLTNTERDILKEIASGKTTKEIAANRNLSIHTIISHRKNIFRKLEVNNVHEATKYAVKAGIIDITDYYI